MEIIGIIIILLLSVKLWALKKQIRSISGQLEKKEPVYGCISIQMIDGDLNRMIVNINRLLDEKNNNQVNSAKRLMWEQEAVAAVSHDMRTPLTSIMGYLQLMQKGKLPEEQRENLEIVLRKAEALYSLIQEFFELSVMEADLQIPDLKKMDLSAILSECILEHYMLFERREIVPVFTYSDERIWVFADETMLVRIFHNLISNGLRYSAGDITFHVQDNGETICLCVKNQVNNKEDIDVNHIFDKFYRADKSRTGKGTGLGLFTVKLLAEKMNSKVTAQIKEDELCILLELLKYSGV